MQCHFLSLEHCEQVAGAVVVIDVIRAFTTAAYAFAAGAAQLLPVATVEGDTTLMPLPMVHLAIAAQLGQADNRPLDPAFLLGSIAPDAIHMRANTTREDKGITHFRRPDQSHNEEEMEAVVARHRRAPKPLPCFTAGYVAHVLTDAYWTERVTTPMRPTISTELTPAERRALYYRETDYVDWALYQHAPWRRAVWEQLEQVEPIAFAPLLTADEIDRWRLRTLRWFDQPPAAPPTAPRFFTVAIVTDFIDHATTFVRQELMKRGMLSAWTS